MTVRVNRYGRTERWKRCCRSCSIAWSTPHRHPRKSVNSILAIILICWSRSASFMALNSTRRFIAIMSDERLHHAMRYSYWNELCTHQKKPLPCPAVFFRLNLARLLLSFNWNQVNHVALRKMYELCKASVKKCISKRQISCKNKKVNDNHWHYHLGVSSWCCRKSPFFSALRLKDVTSASITIRNLPF